MEINELSESHYQTDISALITHVCTRSIRKTQEERGTWGNIVSASFDRENCAVLSLFGR